MALNWKELSLILSELPLRDSYIQKITEHKYNSFTFHLFHKTEKAWLFYVEIGTQHSRVNRTDRIKEKSKNNQRFTQFLRSHLIGRKIVEVYQYPFDRSFSLKLRNSENDINMVFRLFSGPGANLIVTNNEDTILELLYRRPKRGETEGEKLITEERKEEGERTFEVRAYPDSYASFNEFIDRSENENEKNEVRDYLVEKLKSEREHELERLKGNLKKAEEKLDKASSYEDIKRVSELLSSSLYMVRKGMTEITVPDYENESSLTISLSPSLSPSENLEKIYARYKKDKRSYLIALDEIESIKGEIKRTEEHYENLIKNDTELKKLKNSVKEKKSQIKNETGLSFGSQDFTIFVGRNSKENVALLKQARGSDLFLHTRDYQGAYVIIKGKKDKTIPLPVILDAAYLAIFFSKARKNGKADLYVTKAKYLKRIKGAKEGLVIPTQEKNMHVSVDDGRLKTLLVQNKTDEFNL